MVHHHNSNTHHGNGHHGHHGNHNQHGSHNKTKQYTIVIKLGTSSLCHEKTHEPRVANMALIVETVVRLRRDGHRVMIVSSGGIAVGLRQMKLPRRPKHLSAVQAIAAIGQARLIGQWDDMFRQFQQPIAQILLTRMDIADRAQYLNAANTMNELINMGVVPIVNENDTLSVHEIRFGDNDTLSAITAGMINADYLFLLTDVDCLYTDNPRVDPEAKPILVVDNIAKLRVDVSTPGSNVGTGGMTTKLIAAELATSAGVTTIICKSSVPGNIHAIVKYIQGHDSPRLGPVDDVTENISKLDLENNENVQKEIYESLVSENVPLFTRFLPKRHPIKDREFWILHGLTAHGKIYIDRGAYRAITRSNKAGLLPVGIIKCEGHFHTNECVELYAAKRLDSNPEEMDPDFEPILIGRALINYSDTEIDRIKGIQSCEIEALLGYADSEYVAYRDSMAFYKGKRAHEVLSTSEIKALERNITN